MTNNQECPGWTWHHRHSGVPRMDLALSTTRSAQDGLGTIDNQGNMDKRECPGWTLRMDSQDGLPGWIWQHGQSTISGYDNSGHIRGPTPRINRSLVINYRQFAFIRGPSVESRFMTFQLLGMWEYYLRSTTVGSWNPRDSSAKLQQILGESALGSIRGSSIKAFWHHPRPLQHHSRVHGITPIIMQWSVTGAKLQNDTRCR
ncbi:hypothetical protein B0O80DRAFT_500665 [Mortierella sp. GBAus27b]|nr:hypothetical protein B0O80DRAFT_500665 [Mortierella sp. GBAus27b]